MTHFITAFYHFTPITDVQRVEQDIHQKAQELGMQGLLILGAEGVNSTCSSSSIENLEAFKTWICAYLGGAEIAFKDSLAEKAPFRRYKIKIRDEIVTAGIPGMLPPRGNNHHLTPAEWNRVLKEERDAVIIDTRNWYEYQIGTFQGALNPDIEKFTDFPEYIEKQGISKDRKMLIFCTGGIRCEKGILELQRQGYENVYQLEGGILNYLAQFPNDRFEGECFVFDHRVAVDQNLAPSRRYGLCPHCGQPSGTVVHCKRCGHAEKICGDCLKIPVKQDTCSKNCAHQWLLHPGRTGSRQSLPHEVERDAGDLAECRS
ncbi:hypothetical protein EB061_01200 [bacterium]|jgi:UPF0176 protein|nr:hypothetical protein [bacterium]